MLNKKFNVPTVLLLTDIVLDASLQVRPVSDAVADEYAEHLDALPPVTVWEVEGRYLLADGWHRFRAHELAGVAEVRVVVMKGTLEQAKLFVAMCDLRVGVRRTRAAKRLAALLVLGTTDGQSWSDRRIAAHCGVSHTFVALLRAQIASGSALGDDRSSGNVATGSDEVVIDTAPVSGNVATEAARNSDGHRVGNVATESHGGGAQRQRSGGHAAAIEAAGVGLGRHGRGTADEREDDFDGDGGNQLGNDAEVTEVLDDETGVPAFFREADSVTIGDVVRQAERLLSGCTNNEERREALCQVIDELGGILAGLEEHDKNDDSNLGFDAE